MKFRLATLLIGTLFAAITGQAESTALRVGVGSADITPVVGKHRAIMMGGREVTVEKVHDSLQANVVIFEQQDRQVALVSLDLLAIDDAVFDQIRAGIADAFEITDVLCTVTHTHGSGRPVGEFKAMIVERTLAAAKEAYRNLEPARIGHNTGALNEGYNRRVVKSDGSVEMLWNNRDRLLRFPVDDELRVLSIRSLHDDRPLATLVNYSVHPVISMNFDELIVSADWPGAMARKVEDAIGGQCIFLIGSAGDINPYDADMFRYASADEVFARVDEVGGRVAEEVLRTVSTIRSYHADTPLAYDRFNVPMARRSEGLHATKNLSVELSTFLIDQRFALVAIPGELFVELGLDLQSRSPAEATWVVANAYNSSSYLPTLHAACEGGYGATSGTFLEFGAGERLIHQALVSLHYQAGKVKPLDR